ncbi:unnamed protein product [Linum tenue]|uniref:Uncharacterized protein n=1 Tax=Linum tenue TaxID=586396 RepID=A0AAV0INQ9_9ROSI|nr:unnamed protein product [Linum tenue]
MRQIIRRRHVQATDGRPNELPPDRIRPHDNRRRRDPTLQPGIRSGSVQPEYRVRQKRDQQLLQLVLLH